MPTATRQINHDDQPLFSGTHDGADSSSTLRDTGALFAKLGIVPALSQYCENVTQSTGGAITACTDDTVTVTGVTWDYGDEYNIYMTDTKNSFISDQWCDVSRGWKINANDKITENGWRAEDIDLDAPNRKKVFGPGQPEKR